MHDHHMNFARLGAYALTTCILVACASSAAPVDTDVALDGAETTASPLDGQQAGSEGDHAEDDGAAETPKPSCSAPATVNPRWYDDAIGYEIFVRSFRDSDGDGIGDLAGLTASLDYLNDGDPETTDDLGVTLLWLMPIHQSPSYHGYDVTDYDRINADYGSEADLNAMLAAAEARGIRVIVDLVLNHSSSEHPWFLDAKTGQTPTSVGHSPGAATGPGTPRPRAIITGSFGAGCPT